jgi:hypothetical protein
MAELGLNGNRKNGQEQGAIDFDDDRSLGFNGLSEEKMRGMKNFRNSHGRVRNIATLVQSNQESSR